MESVSTAPPVDETHNVEATVEASHPVAPAAERATPASMFSYSAYLHVGPGAEECEHNEDGECTEKTHVHAWCRLPNKFQHRDLYAKGAAAKARRLRLLHEEGSDARELLESELDAFKDDADIETVIDDLLKGEWAQDYVAAVTEVGEREEFEHIEQDRERFVALGEVEAKRTEGEEGEEFKELGKHITAWTGAIKDELERLQEPKRQALRDMGREQLIDQLRKLRMTQLADGLYLHVYNAWEWFICTMAVKKHPVTGRPSERYWAEMGAIDDPKPGSMWGEAPEVIEALEETYNRLERNLRDGVSGNS